MKNNNCNTSLVEWMYVPVFYDTNYNVFYTGYTHKNKYIMQNCRIQLEQGKRK